VAEKCVFDSTELKELRAENKKVRNDLYWVVKERNEFRATSSGLRPPSPSGEGNTAAPAEGDKQPVTYIKTMDGDFILTDMIFKK